MTESIQRYVDRKREIWWVPRHPNSDPPLPKLALRICDSQNESKECIAWAGVSDTKQKMSIGPRKAVSIVQAQLARLLSPRAVRPTVNSHANKFIATFGVFFRISAALPRRVGF